MDQPKHLHRVCDSEPGIRRVRRGKVFVYFDEHGNRVEDPDTLARIRSLAIPPAYSDVWICPDPEGHIQATGRDARGRKQYRYHPEWRCQRDDSKFQHLAAFGRALPCIRARVARDIRLPGLPRAKVLAALVRLLEMTLVRVGNDSYARENRSYGLTTLLNRHVAVDGNLVAFDFRGKSGIRHRIRLRDRTLAGIVRRVRELPGRELFEYLDGNGRVRSLTSEDVNGYLRACSCGDFTAKDFRTWAATRLCLEMLVERGPAPSETQARKTAAQVVARVAEQLRNTAAACRKSYIYPGLIAAYVDGSLFASLDPPDRPVGLQESELQLLAFLENPPPRG